jgi:arylformamidase
MTIYDISRTIAPGVAVYEGDDPLGESLICDIGPDAPCRITKLENWTTHFLTHVDAPRHFLADGRELDEIDLSRFCGPATVVTVHGEAVSAKDVPSVQAGTNILFRTSNSTLDVQQFHENHVYIDESASRRLIDIKPNLVGLDYLSVDCFGDEAYPAHRGLLESDIIILEGIDLSGVKDGEYFLWALPLKIAHADGSPVRAVLSNVQP